MIKPVNGHLLIEPLKHEDFVVSDKQTFEEIGVVVAVAEDVYPVVYSNDNDFTPVRPVEVGDKVYFDSWLAAKYPKNNEEFYWLVKWEDVRAIEHVELDQKTV